MILRISSGDMYKLSEVGAFSLAILPWLNSKKVVAFAHMLSLPIGRSLKLASADIKLTGWILNNLSGRLLLFSLILAMNWKCGNDSGFGRTCVLHFWLGILLWWFPRGTIWVTPGAKGLRGKPLFWLLFLGDLPLNCNKIEFLGPLFPLLYVWLLWPPPPI